MLPSERTTYPQLDPVSTGIKGRCPRCGEGDLFSSISVKDHCTTCHLDYEFSDSGDGPTVFIILALGFIVLGLALVVELNYEPPIWLHIILWPPLILALGLPMLRIVKGILIAQQFKHGAGSGRLDEKK